MFVVRRLVLQALKGFSFFLMYASGILGLLVVVVGIWNCVSPLPPEAISRWTVWTSGAIALGVGTFWTVRSREEMLPTILEAVFAALGGLSAIGCHVFLLPTLFAPFFGEGVWGLLKVLAYSLVVVPVSGFLTFFLMIYLFLSQPFIELLCEMRYIFLTLRSAQRKADSLGFDPEQRKLVVLEVTLSSTRNSMRKLRRAARRSDRNAFAQILHDFAANRRNLAKQLNKSDKDDGQGNGKPVDPRLEEWASSLLEALYV